MIEQLEPPVPPVIPPPRTTCQKCGDRLSTPPIANTGIGCWCRTCQHLLGVIFDAPPQPVLDRLGLALTNIEKQTLEPIPSGWHVEQWYDPDIEEGSIPFDRMIANALSHAA